MKEICPTDELGNETYAASLWPDWDGNMVMYVKAMATAYYGYDELGFGLYNPTNGNSTMRWTKTARTSRCCASSTSSIAPVCLTRTP